MKTRSTGGAWLPGLLVTAAALLAVAIVGAAETGRRPTPQMAPLSAAFLRHVADASADGDPRTEPEAYRLGLRPAPLDMSHQTGARLNWRKPRWLSLPATYDLRPQGRVSAVRNQGQCGSCWAFATYSSLESTALPGDALDLSENHLKNLHGFDPTPCAGGNADMSSAYLARWTGPVNETDDPYGESDPTSPPGLTPVRHVQNVLYLPDRSGPLDNDNIKQAVMTYGVVYTDLRYDSAAYRGSPYFTHYYSGTGDVNHAVGIVGWDDNFDKTRFRTTPPGNGAFICKNSWGTGWGQQGYFYISYYDTRVGIENRVFTAPEPADNYDRVYQYDPLGWTSALGYGSSTAWFANVFTAETSDSVRAVGLFVQSPGSEVHVQVHRSPDNGPLRSSGPAVSFTTTVDAAGYWTLRLPQPVQLNAGERFSVVVRATCPTTSWPIPVEMPFSGYSSAASAAAGQSYISPDGAAFDDLTSFAAYARANVCLKAFTARLTATLTVPDVHAMAGATATLTATLAAETGPIAGQTVAFSVDGQPVGEGVTDGSGTASVPYPIPAGTPFGNRSIAASFAGSPGHTPCSASGTLSIHTVNTTCWVGSAQGAVGDPVRLYFYLYRSRDGVKIQGERLEWQIDGDPNVYSATTDSAGRITFVYTVPAGMDLGPHTITARFAGRGEYGPSQKTGTLTVTTARMTTCWVGSFAPGVGETIKLQMYLRLASSGAGVAGQTITWRIDGDPTDYSGVTGSDGRVTRYYTIPATMAIGPHRITVSYAGSPAYLPSSTYNTINVRVATRPWVGSYTGSRGDPVRMTLLLKRLDTNAPMPGELLTWTVAGDPTLYSGTTGPDGKIAWTYTVPQDMAIGPHNITVDYAGNTTFATSRFVNTLTVTEQAATVLWLQSPTGPPGATVQMRFLLRLVRDLSGVPGQPLAWRIAGDPNVYSGVTDAAGWVRQDYTIPLDMTPGLHRIDVSYAGSDVYAPSSTYGNLTVTTP